MFDFKLKKKNNRNDENLRSKFSSLSTIDYRLFTSAGFTLVEVILYISIVVTIVSVSSVFLAVVVESRIKNGTVSEVEQQGIHTTQVILDTIRNADGIISPTIGTANSSITIDAVGITNDPTIFSLNNGTILVSEGGNSAIPLTNSYVEISNLNFINTAKAGTLDIIRVSFTMNYKNSSGKKEYDYSRVFYGSASIR